MGGFIHEPVMLRETLEWIRPAAGGVYCDGTLGGGGHSEAILKAAGPGAALYGIDRDETAVAAASERLKEYLSGSQPVRQYGLRLSWRSVRRTRVKL